MRYFYDERTDVFGETADELPIGVIELDPIKAEKFVYAEQRGQRVDRSRIDEFKLDPEAACLRLIEAHRSQRNALLAASDWTQLPDAFGGNKARQALWVAYRQQLRDLQFTGEIVWPASPG